MSFGPDFFRRLCCFAARRPAGETVIPIPPLAEFKREVGRGAEYVLFVHLSNEATADHYLANAHEYLERNCRRYFTAPFYREFLASTLDGFRKETRKLAQNEDKLARMSRRAAAGDFAGDLLDPRNHWYPEGVGPNDIVDEVDYAAYWVIKASMTLNGEREGPQARHNLANAMRNVVRQRDVLDVSTLDYLQQHSGELGAQTRWGGNPILDSTVPYGGTGIGKFLQQRTAQRARGLARTKGDGAADGLYWYDVASFLMVGYLLAHGYGDGNGRSARALFACTLIKNNVVFAPPAYQWTLNQVKEENLGVPILPVVPQRPAMGRRGSDASSVVSIPGPPPLPGRPSSMGSVGSAGSSRRL